MVSMELSQALRIFLDGVPFRSMGTTPLTPKFQSLLKIIGGYAPLIFVFDIEFQHLRKERSKRSRHLLEFGGMLFMQNKQKEWSYLGSIHFNLPPVGRVDNLGVIQSKYATVSPKTQARMEEIEEDYLFYKVLELNKDNPSDFVRLYREFVRTPLAKKKRIPHIDPVPENFAKIIRVFKDMSFTLGKSDVGSANFSKVWKLYLNDPWVKSRTLTPTKRWLEAFAKVVTSSVPVVKGNMDIIALDNLFERFRMPAISDRVPLFDIAIFNTAFRQLCSSAELEKTYWCLLEKSLVDPELEPSLKGIYRDLAMRERTLVAHNPLVDSFYTLVVALTMGTRLDMTKS
jgi:hypothetical protein